MPPITLKLGGKKEDLPFSKLGQEELCNTWRLVAKVKDALEEGTRLENLSWRLWFLQNVLGKGSKPPKPTTTEEIPSLPTKQVKRVAPPKKTTVTNIEPVTMTTDTTTNIDCNNNKIATETFKMHQFSSDQANDPAISFIDMFGPEGMQEFLNSISDIPFTTTTTTTTAATTLNQLDYLNSGNNTLFDNTNNFGLMDNLLETNMMAPDECYTDPLFLNYNMMNPNSFTAFPNATLHNKLLATLPKQTLQSAERLLAPPSSVPQKKPPPPLPEKRHQEHYYSTFQAQSEQQQQQNESHQICSNCDATSTPLWRRSADDQLLCNACGLYLKLHNAPRPKNMKNFNRKDEFITDIYAISHQPVSSSSDEQQQCDNVCSNCSTTTTPLWRRDNEGLTLCNACGLYLKLHNEKRPLSMKTSTVKKRQRTDTNERYYEKNSLPGTGVFVMSKPTHK